MKLGELMTPNPSRSGRRHRSRTSPHPARHGISGVPVIGERLEVSRRGLRGRHHRQGGRPDPRDRRLISWLLGASIVDRQKIEARTAAEAMESLAITVGARQLVAMTARLMTDQIESSPSSTRRALIGIVTRTDLVRAFTGATTRSSRTPRDPARDPLARRAGSPPSRRARRGQAGRQDAAALGCRASRRGWHARARSPGVHSTVRWTWDDARPAKERPARVPGGSAGNRR